MAGILPDFSSGPAGLLGFLSNLLSPTQANAQQPGVPGAPQPNPGLLPQPIQGPLPFGQRPLEALGGFLNAPGGVIGGLTGGIKTLATGELSDPSSIQQNNQRLMYHNFIAQGFTPQQALMAIMSPKIGENAGSELMKGTINPTIQIAPDGSILVQRPYGQIGVPGGVPVSEKSEITNPDGSKSPAFLVKPSLTNQSGRVALPGAGTPNVAAGLPPTRPPVPSNDPTMTVSPRQVAQNNPLITEQSPQAKAEQEKTGQGLGDQFMTIQNESAAATRTLPTIQRMRQLNLDPNLPEGKLAPAFNTLRSALISMGIPAKSAAPGELLDALHNKMTVDMNPNSSLGTGFSNADRDYMDAISPALNNTKEGRTALIDAAEKVQTRKQEVAKLAVQYKSQNRGSLDGFQPYLADWANQHPLFPEPPPTNFNGRFGAAGGSSGGGNRVRTYNPATGKIE